MNTNTNIRINVFNIADIHIKNEYEYRYMY
jgi:hypothetical protein